MLRVSKLFLIAFVFLLPLCLSSADRPKRVKPVSENSLEEFEHRRNVAVLVGVGAYPEESGFSKLAYSAADARDLTRSLEKAGYSVRTLTDTKATRNLVRQTLIELQQVVEKDAGTVVFFFSGHGFARQGENYLATYDSVVSGLASSGISQTEVERLLKGTGAQRRILLLDACRDEAGTGTKGLNGVPRIKYLAAAEGTRVLYSTSPGQVSYENEDLHHGVFTYFLLKALEGSAAGSDGLVTFRDIVDFVVDEVRTYSFGRGRLQIPKEAGESTGDFLISRVERSTNRGSIPEGNPVTEPTASVSVVNAPEELTHWWQTLKARQDGVEPSIKAMKESLKQMSPPMALNPKLSQWWAEAQGSISDARGQLNSGDNEGARKSMKAAEAALDQLALRGYGTKPNP